VTAYIDLDGAAAVVTGAGSGIGRACARSFAARGARVVVSDVNAARVADVTAEIESDGGRAVGFTADVTEQTAAAGLRETSLDHFGRVDLVMNNVGVLTMGPPEAIGVEEWQRVIDVNLLSMVRSNLVFLPLLLAQGRGHVVNTASMSGLLAHGYDRLPYVTTKHAIVGMSESLALYLRPRGIGVTCLCPSGVNTNIVEQMTFVGSPSTPRSPDYPVVEAEVVGELVADAVADGRFLVLTVPEVHDEMVERAADIDAYLTRLNQDDPR
jgi:NAD(P)-dependent dehydrogenase (short-subunit alcohol dehydrogenase family)